MLKIVDNIIEANAITHGGRFHADEVFSAILIEKVLQNVKLYRVADNTLPPYYPDQAIIFDIGKGDFDHHQKGGNGARINGCPYASFGLLWKKYGMQISEQNSQVYEYIDKVLVQGIDYVDSGKFRNNDVVQILNISRMIAMFNTNWQDRIFGRDDLDDDAFMEAFNFAKLLFEKILKTAKAKVEAHVHIRYALSISKDHVMILDMYAPWKYTVLSDKLPPELAQKADELWFVIYPSLRGGYNWQTVPVASGLKRPRKPVPTEWWGKEGEILQKITGIETAKFCHSAGFIGGAEKLNDCIAMVEAAKEAAKL